MDVKKILDELYRDKYALLEKVARLEAELEAERKGLIFIIKTTYF